MPRASANGEATTPSDAAQELEHRRRQETAALERQVIGGMMLWPDTIDDTADVVGPEDFLDDSCRTLYAAILTLHDQGHRTTNGGPLLEELQRRGQLAAAGGARHMAACLHAVQSHATTPWAAEQVRSRSLRRQLHQAGADTMRDAGDPGLDIHDGLGAAEQRIHRLSEHGLSRRAETLATPDLMRAVLADIDARRAGDLRQAVPSGYRTLDDLTGGLRNGSLIVLAARPGIGKSALAANIATNAARHGDEHPVLVFSLEMGAAEYGERMLSAISGVAGVQMRSGMINDQQRARLTEAAALIGDLPVLINDEANINTRQIAAMTRRAQRRHNTRLVVIDYLQLIQPAGGETREQQVATITRQLKLLAKACDLPVLLLSQLNRRADEGGEPRLSHLRECLAEDTTLLFGEAGPERNSQTNRTTSKLFSHTRDRAIRPKASEAIDKQPAKVIRLKLRSGRFVDCTPSHLILTDRGWVAARDITVDHAVATARKLTRDGEHEFIPHARFMGWMLGNGGMRGESSPSLITSDDELFSAFEGHVAQLFGLQITEKRRRGNWREGEITKGSYGSEPNPCKRWLKAKGMWGRAAPDKEIPTWFLATADDASIAALLSGLYETDGSVVVRNGRTSLRYTTTSHRLAWQTLWCLGVLGIHARIYGPYRSEKSRHDLFEIRIEAGTDLGRFRERCALIGKRGRALAAAELPQTGGNHGDRLGTWAARQLLEVARELGISQTELGYRDQGKRISQRDLAAALDRIQSTAPTPPEPAATGIRELRNLIRPDVFWDRLKAIEDLGDQPVEIFDRLVPDTHNFVANGIIVHNSGAIEQDADAVMFLHQPDPAANPAHMDLLLRKQRNGPTGNVPLYFHRGTVVFTERDDRQETTGQAYNPNLTTEMGRTEGF